ncbi:hypothetical protein [Parapedobacter soli]|uniref:hypothetical protein n=1 Tax=Parapedobacter soli TaxID=416955 RepID=UPI0021C794BB|nr:hypothetical protein [Parapedobacter soli]
MNKLPIPLAIVLLLSSGACQPSTDRSESKSGHKEGQAEQTFEAGRDYTEFTRVKVMDRQGFATPVEALSILIPRGWQDVGEVIWVAPGQACAGTTLFFKAHTPDGASGFEIMPNYIWSWSADPQVNAFNQQHGNGQFCGVGQPMDAAQFVQQVWAQELGNPTITAIKTNPDAIATMGENDAEHRAEMMRYGSAGVEFNHSAVTAMAKWPDGKSGILFCKVTNAANYIPNIYNGTTSVSYTSSATRMVYLFPEPEKEHAEQMMTVILTSIRTNPAWKEAAEGYWRDIREQRHVEHVGRIQMMDEQTRRMGEQAIQRGNRRLAEMDNQLRSWEARQSANDKIHNDFIKTIREVENYRDVAGKVELSAGYDHVWSRSDGQTYIMTNNPNFNPAAVFQDQNWQEMEKVD